MARWDLCSCSIWTVGAGAATGGFPVNLLQNSGGTFTALTNNNIDELILVPAPTNADSDSVDGVFTIEVAADTSVGLNGANDLLIEDIGGGDTDDTLTNLDQRREHPRH